jgi:flagellar motor component MotA
MRTEHTDENTVADKGRLLPGLVMVTAVVGLIILSGRF